MRRLRLLGGLPVVSTQPLWKLMLRQSVISAARAGQQEDNPAMTEDRDLLPWILGALSIAAVTMAIAVGLAGRTAPAHPSGQTTSSAPALATAELNPKTQSSAAPAGNTPAPSSPSSSSPSSTAPSSTTPPSIAPSSIALSSIAPSSTALSSAAQAYPEPASAQGGSGAQAQAAAGPNAGSNQIWECTTNGVKTFSNNRCGSAAVLRELGPINVMDASPASNVHWYGSGPNNAPDYYDSSYDPGPPQPADNSYPVVVGVPYLERRRAERPRQAAHHDQGHHVQGHPRGN
jgi:hypothetical protein